MWNKRLILDVLNGSCPLKAYVSKDYKNDVQFSADDGKFNSILLRSKILT